MAQWNPWHGCHKVSAGCQNCYVYRIDARHGRDPSVVVKNRDFDMPVRRTRRGEYKIPSGDTVYTCFSSDFLVAEADEWRTDAWKMIKRRSDLYFFMITKRIDRFEECLPADWGDGYDNVAIACTVENQQMADYRLPIYLAAPIKHKSIVCEPLLGELDIRKYLCSGSIEHVVAGGESGEEARVCRYEWITGIAGQCAELGIPFSFKQTGARLMKDGRLYRIPRRLQHTQARRAGISTRPWRPVFGEKEDGAKDSQSVLTAWREEV